MTFLSNIIKYDAPIFQAERPGTIIGEPMAVHPDGKGGFKFTVKKLKEMNYVGFYAIPGLHKP